MGKRRIHDDGDNERTGGSFSTGTTFDNLTIMKNRLSFTQWMTTFELFRVHTSIRYEMNRSQLSKRRCGVVLFSVFCLEFLGGGKF